MQNELLDVFAELGSIHEDTSIPRNVRVRVQEIMAMLSSEGDLAVKVDKSLEGLSSVAEDPNIPSYVRMQLWSVLSALESAGRN